MHCDVFMSRVQSKISCEEHKTSKFDFPGWCLHLRVAVSAHQGDFKATMLCLHKAWQPIALPLLLLHPFIIVIDLVAISMIAWSSN